VCDYAGVCYTKPYVGYDSFFEYIFIESNCQDPVPQNNNKNEFQENAFQLKSYSVNISTKFSAPIVAPIAMNTPSPISNFLFTKKSFSLKLVMYNVLVHGRKTNASEF
jgi:hypothetical protein